MLPTNDAARPLPGQPDSPAASAADAPRPTGGGPSASPGPPVASQRPSHGHSSHQSHGQPHTGGHAGHGSHGPAHGPSHGHGSGPSRREGGRETKSAGSPNIQDVFLNYARREKLTVVIQLLDGQSVEGRIKNFDRFALIIDHAGVDHLVFKHAIATIRSPRSIGSYYASHEAS
jgi:host factor-I protein